MSTLLLAALAATPVTYAYREAPPGGARRYEVTDWSKVPRVYAATSRATVRERPEPDAGVVAELPFGVEVKVLQVVTAEPVELDGRGDRWYRVASEGRAGYLFGASLTHARFEADFDGDGVRELATVAFEAHHAIRVRFYEPEAKTERFIDLRPLGGGFIGLEGGYAYPELVAKAKAGLALVHVDSHVDACASFGDYWVSYRDGQPLLALELSGIADPPAMARYRVEWQPSRRRALVHRTVAEDDQGGERTWSEAWALDGGVFIAPPKRE